MTWTTQQSEGLADWTAHELSNRQLLLKGSGVPDFDAPIQTDYSDVSTDPPTRYRKVRVGVEGWVQYTVQRAASQAEVDEGLDRENFVSSATLAVRLTAFADELIGTGSGTLDLLADDSGAGAGFTIAIPLASSGIVLSITVSGYGAGASLVNITGGTLGQIVTVQRGPKAALSVESNANLKLTSTVTLDDLTDQDNLTLQKVTENIWVELSRTLFE